MVINVSLKNKTKVVSLFLFLFRFFFFFVFGFSMAGGNQCSGALPPPTVLECKPALSKPEKKPADYFIEVLVSREAKKFPEPLVKTSADLF